MEIEFVCAGCQASNQLEADELDSEVICTSCGRNYEKASAFADPKNGIQYCGICGCKDLYIQKDFNRKIGCLIVAIGAVLAPFTKLISLFVCALIDLILWRTLPSVTVCYKCRSIYRGFPVNSLHQGFNLGINDRYRVSER